MVRFLWSMHFDSAEVVFINLYWKDDRSGKTGAFCKHKSSSLHNEAVEVIYSLPRSGHDGWRRHLLSTIRIVQASEKVCNRKYLLKVVQAVYLGWPLREYGNEIDSSFAELLFLCGNHGPRYSRYSSIRSACISHEDPPTQ